MHGEYDELHLMLCRN